MKTGASNRDDTPAPVSYLSIIKNTQTTIHGA